MSIQSISGNDYLVKKAQGYTFYNNTVFVNNLTTTTNVKQYQMVLYLNFFLAMFQQISLLLLMLNQQFLLMALLMLVLLLVYRFLVLHWINCFIFILLTFLLVIIFQTILQTVCLRMFNME